MTDVMFTFTRNYPTTMIASVRIGRFLQDLLGVPLWDERDLTEVPRRVRRLVIVNGAYAFCKKLAELGEMIEKAERVIWVQNDYTIIPPKPESDAESPFRKAFVNRRAAGKSDTSYWSTCHDWSKLPGSHYVNWNALTLDETVTEQQIARGRKSSGSDLFYYGAWRSASGKSGRVRYFDRYFASPALETTVSSPAKQFEKYDKIRLTPKIDENFSAELRSHGLGLYIEDRLSHERFHSPANRFYEMLSAGLPMVFQPECGTSLRRAGYDTTEFAVATSRDAARAMPRREEIGAAQRLRWLSRARDEKRGVANVALNLWKEK